MPSSEASRVCVDASFVVRLVSDPGSKPVQEQWHAWQDASMHACAPALLRFEVTNALYRYHSAGPMSLDWVHTALGAALALPIEIHDEAQLHRQAVGLAARLGLPAAYDAHYLALASSLSLPLWTADRRLFNAVRSALKWVHYAG